MFKFRVNLTVPIALTSLFLISPTLVATAEPMGNLAHPVKPYTISQSTTTWTGTYTAQTGETIKSRRWTRLCTDPTNCPASRRQSRTITPNSLPVTITINSFSSSSEIQKIRNAGAGNFTKAVSAYQHGTVTYNGGTYAINLATYRTAANGNYLLTLVSASPLTKTGQQSINSATGNAVSMIELSIPKSGGIGGGTLYQSIQVNVSSSGEVLGQGGVTTSTALNNVVKSK